jgi:NAD(P)-dependent dehydrogenase (short-subunit alcohol dehydrogenase family)
MASSAASSGAPDPRNRHPQPPFKNQKELHHPGSDADMDPRPDWGEKSYKGCGKLKGQVALITGGDSGIGRAVAIAFAREGASVALSFLPSEQADADECKRMVETGDSVAKCVLLPGDLADKDYCAKVVEDTVKALGRLNILVNNAAYQGKARSGIGDLSYERIQKTFNINIVSFFEVTKAALKHMKPGGSIINTGSIQAYDPSHPILDYACTKAAIVAFTKGLSQELVGKGIRVNCVAPGPIWTPLVASSFPKEKLETFGEKNPMKRPGQPAELAPAYVFLASPDSSYVSGEVLGVTGGGILA